MGGSAFSICEELLAASSNPRRAVNNPHAENGRNYLQNFNSRPPEGVRGPIWTQFSTSSGPIFGQIALIMDQLYTRMLDRHRSGYNGFGRH